MLDDDENKLAKLLSAAPSHRATSGEVVQRAQTTHAEFYERQPNGGLDGGVPETSRATSKCAGANILRT